MPQRRPAQGSEVIRYDKPKPKCDGGCAGCKAGKPCMGKKGMGPASRKTKTPESNMDRADSLTPQEYLAACDLGIQGQSRTYIRAHLDAAERLDKKCGNSGIAEGKQCRKGGGGVASTIGKVAAGAGVIAGGVAAVKNRSAIKSAVKSTAMKGAAAAGYVSGIKKTQGMAGVAALAGRNSARAGNAMNKAATQTVGAVKSAVATGKARAMSGAARVKNTAKAVSMNPGRSMKVGKRRVAQGMNRARKTVRSSMAGFSGS